jgi:hypothetical protein
MTEFGKFLGRTTTVPAGVLGLAFLLGACGGDPAISGGSSDQGNAVKIVLNDPDGRPVRHAEVRVRADSWTPGSPLEKGRFADALTDSLGRVVVTGLGDGGYVVEALRDSLVGSTGTIVLDDGTVSANLVLEKGSSLVLRSSDPGATGFAVRGLDRTALALGGGRYQFQSIPRATLRIETRFAGRISLNTLPALRSGSHAEAVVAGDTLKLESGSFAGLAIPAVSGNLFANTTLDLVPAGLAANPQRRLDDGNWVTTASSLRLDSTFGGVFRLTNGSWSSEPTALQWNLWQGRPRELFDFAADGTDTTGSPDPTLDGAARLTDSTGTFLRIDSTQSVDWGLSLMDSLPEGAVEIHFRPGPGFRDDRAYSILSNNVSRLGIGYLRGMLYFVKSADFVHRWVTSPTGQLRERRWYRILATWGPQGMTLSVDGNLVGWSADVSGYSPGANSASVLTLRSGAKDSCCLEVLGIVSPQKLDGDISAIHLYTQQPIVWGARLPRQCPDSVAGDLRSRCGAGDTPRDFEILH